MITDKQRKERLNGIGGSDMPIILGLSHYKTPYQLFLEKRGITIEEKEESQSQYWGNKLERVIIDEFIVRNKVTVERPDTVVHPIYSFMRANVDGYIPEYNSVLEIKCSSSFLSKEWGESGSDIMPIQYIVQVAHYCSCLNTDKAYVAVLIGGNDYREYIYERDLQLESKIIDSAKEFWEMVQNNTPPHPKNIDDIILMYPNHMDAKSIIADDSNKYDLSRLNELKKSYRSINNEINSLKLNVMNSMKDAEYISDELGSIMATWKANSKGRRIFLLKGE